MVSDFEAVRNAVAKLGVGGWTVVLGLSLVNYGLRLWRWELYLSFQRCRVATFKDSPACLAGFALATMRGKAGEAVRSLIIDRFGVAYVNTLAAFFAEGLVDLVAIWRSWAGFCFQIVRGRLF